MIHDYGLQEKAKKLAQLLKKYWQGENPLHQDVKALQADTYWGASYFFADVIHQAQLNDYFLSKSSLTKLKSKYEAKHNVQIDLDRLFNKHWLRMILKDVKIPGVIRSASAEATKIVDKHAEILFLNEVISTLIKDKWKPGIYSQDFKEYLKTYNKSKQLNITIEQLLEQKLIEEKGENKDIYISNVNYYVPIIENSNEFGFIRTMYDQKYRQQNIGFIIKKHQFKTLLRKHKKHFSNTPSLKNLESQKVIRSVSKQSYVFTLSQTDIRYGWALVDKIGALLWEKLLADDQLKTDKTRFKHWLKKVNGISGWSNAPAYLSHEAKERLLDITLNAILNEPDIVGLAQEVEKLKLDRGHNGFTLLDKPYPVKYEPLPDNGDLYELYMALKDLDDESHSNLVSDQEIRSSLDYLIYLIVKSDGFYHESGENYNHIITLLENSHNRPYLLWNVFSYVIRHRPEVIPYLIARRDTASLGIVLTHKLPVSSDLSNDITTIYPAVILEAHKTTLWQNSLTYLLEALTKQYRDDDVLKAKVLFQSLLVLEREKFNQINYNNYKESLKTKEEIIGRLEQARELIQKFPLPHNLYPQDSSFLSLILPHLFLILNQYNRKPFIFGTITLDLYRFDMLFWILEYSNRPGYLQANGTEHVQASVVASEILESYLAIINLEKIEKVNIDTREIEKQLPRWSSNQYGLDLIPWEMLTIQLQKDHQLNDFLTPTSFRIKKAKDKYDEMNRFIGDKIRTHLAILLLIHERLHQQFHSLKDHGEQVESTIDKIEITLIDYISDYSVDDAQNRRIDLFDEHFERIFSHQKELLPKIAQAINGFREHNRNQLIKALAQSNDLVRLLKLFEFITNEGSLNYLKEQIKQSKIKEYLRSKYWLPEIKSVLIGLVNHEEFIQQVEEVLRYWEEKIIKQKDQDDSLKILAYRVKLILAYHEGTESSLGKVKPPELERNRVGDPEYFDVASEEDFYRALIKLKNDQPQEAYAIFENQFKTTDDKPVLALNRFAAKIKWAEGEKDMDEANKLMAEAIDEWETFEIGISEKELLNAVLKNVWLNKLTVYHRLEHYHDFDTLYSKLERPYQMQRDFLTMRIANLLQRNMEIQANELLLDASVYHQFYKGKIPEFITELRHSVDTDKVLKKLRLAYSDMITREPESLIKIIPDSINKYTSLPEFIIHEIVFAANQMLKNINSISEIRNENKYNDLLVLALNSRIKSWGWYVGEQERKGYPESDQRNPGELDFAIYGGDPKLAVCESLNLGGKYFGKSSRHVLKSLNYDNERKLIFIINYFIGKRENFEPNWEKYKTDVVPLINYPEDLPLFRKKLVDKTKNYGVPGTINVGKTKLGKDTLMYHLYININYRV